MALHSNQTGAAEKEGGRQQRTGAAETTDGRIRRFGASEKGKKPLWAFFYSDYFWWNPNCRRQMERHAEKASNRKSAESKR